ncbi:Cys-tRNA(Pro) deacylase [Specibacter sp. NPDC078692]|uniref:Cys-tRNA(Pro) deacylase n=1 Tax=Specibacter sp. NPDC078692 TaxID=3155818 RepID=UPI0034267C41
MAKKNTASKNGAAGTGTPATVALTQSGISFTAHPYDHDPANTNYGMEAATVLGIEPARVFKTLMTDVAGTLAVAIVPGDGTLDLKAMAQTLGHKKATMADPATAQRRTGYVLGGISPIGQRQHSPTILDESALNHETILVSGGRRGFDIELAPRDLITITKATTAKIGSPTRQA